jgi:hypothetical protein
MKNMRVLFLSAIIALTGAASASAQANDPGVTANGVIGEVVAVDANAKQVFVKTDAGSVVTVAVADNTQFKKLPPGETTLSKATDMAFSALSAGDRVFARGALSEDRKTVTARMVIAMTKTDLAQKHEADRAEWSRRGIVGVVTALNPAAKEITIQPLGGPRPQAPQQQPQGAPAGAQGGAQAAGPQAGGPPAPPAPVVVAAGASSVKFRRYAPDSVKFSDAKASTFEELKVGDQIRALGERSADGARFTPEEVVSGAFRTVLGTITSVNAATRELQIKTMPGDQPMTVVVSKDSDVKQVPAEFAQMMGGGGRPGGPGGGGAPGAGGGAPAGGGPGAGGARPGGGEGPGAGGPRRMGGGMQEMLERLPAATFEELKQGSMVVFSTTGADPARATAIQLIAGIDPIVQMMQARAAAQGRPVNLGSFNLGIGQP